MHAVKRRDQTNARATRRYEACRQRSWVLTVILLLVVVGRSRFTAFSALADEVRFPRPIATFSGDELEQGRGGVILDFAISPDNSTVAVAFDVVEGPGKVGLWLGEWGIKTKKPIARVRLDESDPGRLALMGLDHETIRYTRDGSTIAFEAGHRFYALEAADLKLRFAISTRGAEGGSNTGEIEPWFEISSNGNALAVHSGESLYPVSRAGMVSLYDLGSGRELSHWPAPAHFSSFAISPDGSQLLAAVFESTDPGDIQLLDSASGHMIRSFTSGFERLSSGDRDSEVVFLDGDHFVASPGPGIDGKGDYSGDSLKVFDSRTGNIAAELTYDKLGPSGEVWVSDRDSTVATLNLWMSHFERRFDFSEGGPKRAQFLFFHAHGGDPFCVVGPLPEANNGPRQSGFIRFSPDLGLVGLFVNGELAIYSMPECEEPHK
jgi:hypothetical protein